MKFNTPNTCTLKTHEGGPSSPLKPIEQLRRTVLACLLWEDTFYEDGKSIADRIEETVKHCEGIDVLRLCIDAHVNYHLRHAPLWLMISLIKHHRNLPGVADAIERLCGRPDQMTELLALYWKDGRRPIPAQMKKGLARAFCKFDEYQLAKWNKGGKVKLKDVLFMCHAKPKDDAQAEVWKRLVSNDLKTADTWETRLSDGQDKKESFQELLEMRKMGTMAILMNLRNMQQSGVSKDLVKANLVSDKIRPMLPFKFIAAAKACPQWEDMVDEAMVMSIRKKEKLPGLTFVYVDVSGSMQYPMSVKSEMNRQDAAAAFAILLRECCEKVEIFTFSNQCCYVPSRHGMALKDAIAKSQPNAGTDLDLPMRLLEINKPKELSRVIVITDEQVNSRIQKVSLKNKYILNVGSNKNGIENFDNWLQISGFAEASIDYIREVENEKVDSHD